MTEKSSHYSIHTVQIASALEEEMDSFLYLKRYSTFNQPLSNNWYVVTYKYTTDPYGA